MNDNNLIGRVMGEVTRKITGESQKNKAFEVESIRKANEVAKERKEFKDNKK